MAGVQGHQEDQVQAVRDHREVPVALAVPAVQEVQVQQEHDEVLHLHIIFYIIPFRMLYNDKSPGS